jgi:hypothetical protein
MIITAVNPFPDCPHLNSREGNEFNESKLQYLK